MAVTIIYGERTTAGVNAAVEGEALWLSHADLARATGWEIKPQGACLGERCVPIPTDRAAEFVRPGGFFNLTALARHTGQPFAMDDHHAIWSFAATAEEIGSRLRTLTAPDFTLPDLDGNMHSLSDYRGRKVLLLSWASW